MKCLWFVLVFAVALSACQSHAPDSAGSAASAPAALTASEARTIARDAYVYGVPLVDQWKTMYAFSIDKSNSQYKGPCPCCWRHQRWLS